MIDYLEKDQKFFPALFQDQTRGYDCRLIYFLSDSNRKKSEFKVTYSFGPRFEFKIDELCETFAVPGKNPVFCSCFCFCFVTFCLD
jgi:hypothetical protein